MFDEILVFFFFMFTETQSVDLFPPKELFGTLSAKHPKTIPGTLTFAPHPRRQLRSICVHALYLLF